MHQHFIGFAVGAGKQVFARFLIDNAVVQVHGAARLVLVRLGHESGVQVVLEGRFPRGAFEQEYLVRQFQRIAMHEVDLYLGNTVFMGVDVRLDSLLLGKLIYLFDDFLVFIKVLYTESAARGTLPAGAADRGLQRQIRVGIGLEQVEFYLRADNGLPAAPVIEFDPPVSIPAWELFSREPRRSGSSRG